MVGKAGKKTVVETFSIPQPIGELANVQKVYLIEGESADVIESGLANIGPIILGLPVMACITIGLIVIEQTIQAAKHGIIEPVTSPIDILQVAGMGCIGFGAKPQDFTKLLQRLNGHITWTGLHGCAMKGDFKATLRQFPDVGRVTGVLQRMGALVITGLIPAIKGPDTLGGIYSQFSQAIINRPDVSQGGNVGIIEDRKNEILSVRYWQGQLIHGPGLSLWHC